MIRRALRLLFRIGLITGVGAAVAKLVQSRRATTNATMPSGEPPVQTGPPKSTQPLVEPSMLQGLDLRKGETDQGDPDNGQVTSAPASVTEGKTAASAPASAAPSAPATAPAKKQPAAAPPAGRTWVEPQGGVCPSSHPVKAKLSSSIFHLPGMTAYERTTPDRCYTDAAAAEADGLRQAKR